MKKNYKNFAGFCRKYATRLLAITAFFTATQKMQSQTTPDFAINQYSTIQTAVKYDGLGSDPVTNNPNFNTVAAGLDYQETVGNNLLKLNVLTNCLNMKYVLEENANVPSYVFHVGDLEATAGDFQAWVSTICTNCTDTSQAYLYQLEDGQNVDAWGWEYSPSNSDYYAASVSWTGLENSSLWWVYSHEIFYAVSDIIHNDHPYGKGELTIEVDPIGNGTWVSESNKKTVLSDGLAPGQYDRFMTGNPANFVVDRGGYVHFQSGGYPARILATALDDDPNNSYDNMTANLGIGGSAHDHIKELPVIFNGVNNDITAKTPEILLNGNVVSLTNFTEFQSVNR